jgi:hypothetical protein
MLASTPRGSKSDLHDPEGGELIERRISIEASTRSEWVARCLERPGHEVIVADPSFALMYAGPARGARRAGPHANALHRAIRSRLRQEGWRVPTGTAEGFSRRVLALPLPGRLRSVEG